MGFRVSRDIHEFVWRSVNLLKEKFDFSQMHLITLCPCSIKKIMINAYKVLQEPYAFSEHILDKNKKLVI